MIFYYLLPYYIFKDQKVQSRNAARSPDMADYLGTEKTKASK